MLATTQLWAMADGELAPAASHPKSARHTSTTNRHKTPVPFLRPSVLALRQEEGETVELSYTPKKCPHRKMERGKASSKGP